jgi:spore coat polysaccharide biosynthesis protein SpsF (cytidylyltransferase family)
VINDYDWFNLCRNPNAIDLIEQNKEHIDWREISENPEIFEINHVKTQERVMKESMKLYTKN